MAVGTGSASRIAVTTLEGSPCYSVTPVPSGFLLLPPVGPGQLLLFCWMSYCPQSGEKGLCLALSSFQILPVNSQYLFCKKEWVIFIPQLREHCFRHRPASTTSLWKENTNKRCLRIMINLNTHSFIWLYLVWIYTRIKLEYCKFLTENFLFSQHTHKHKLWILSKRQIPHCLLIGFGIIHEK